MTRFEVKLVLVFAIFLAGIAALVSLIDMRAEQQIVGGVEKDIKNIVNTVHFSIQKLSAEPGPDRQALERFIEEARQNKAVREVSVIGNAREVVASSNPEKVGEHRELSGQEVLVREESGSTKSTARKIRYDIRVPLFRNDQVVGLVQTYLEIEDYKYLLHQLYVKNLIITAVAMLFGLGTVFVAVNRINRPLRRLVSAADQVAEGDLTVQLVPQSRDEVGRLTTSFDVMVQKLAVQRRLEEKLHEMERQAILAEMASNLAHEIRNPLNLINLTADYLGQQYLPDEGERRTSFNELIAGLKAEVRQLNDTVSEFLNLGRPSKLKRTKFAWAGLFDEIEPAVKSQLISKSVALQFSGETGLLINADREQMRLVLMNLLLNSLEAVPEGGSINVDVGRSADSKEILVSVADDGPGIPPEDLPHIFDPYFTTRPTGIGLGLALVRRVVEEHGGKIHAVNLPTGGAKFEITLPMEG